MWKLTGKSVRYKIIAFSVILIVVCALVLFVIYYFSSNEQLMRAVGDQLKRGSSLTASKIVNSNFGNIDSPWEVDINGTFTLKDSDIKNLYQPYPFKHCNHTDNALCQYANWQSYTKSSELFINHEVTNTDNKTYCAQISVDREIKGTSSDFHSICVNLITNTVWYRYYVP